MQRCSGLLPRAGVTCTSMTASATSTVEDVRKGPAAVPSDKPLHLIGQLRSGPIFLELHVDGGGIWELDPTHVATQLIGRRVEVIGTQIGFNDLLCHEIWPAGTPRPQGTAAFFRRHTLWLWALGGFIAVVLLSYL